MKITKEFRNYIKSASKLVTKNNLSALNYMLFEKDKIVSTNLIETVTMYTKHDIPDCLLSIQDIKQYMGKNSDNAELIVDGDDVYIQNGFRFNIAKQPTDNFPELHTGGGIELPTEIAQYYEMCMNYTADKEQYLSNGALEHVHLTGSFIEATNGQHLLHIEVPSSASATDCVIPVSHTWKLIKKLPVKIVVLNDKYINFDYGLYVITLKLVETHYPKTEHILKNFYDNKEKLDLGIDINTLNSIRKLLGKNKHTNILFFNDDILEVSQKNNNKYNSYTKITTIKLPVSGLRYKVNLDYLQPALELGELYSTGNHSSGGTVSNNITYVYMPMKIKDEE